jgi:hypothetical protein
MRDAFDLLITKVILIVCLFVFKLVFIKLARCIQRLTLFAQEYACLPTLGYTHMQYVLLSERVECRNGIACLIFDNVEADLNSLVFVLKTSTTNNCW